MPTKKLVIGYSIGHQHRTRGYSHEGLVITLYPLRWTNYTKQMQEWIHNSSHCEYLRSKAAECIRATGRPEGLVYQDGDHNRLEFYWLGYRYNADSPGEWIAGHLTECHFDNASQEVLKVVGKFLQERGKDTRPDEFIAFLQSKGSLAVHYNQEADCYLPEDIDIELSLNADHVPV